MNYSYLKLYQIGINCELFSIWFFAAVSQKVFVGFVALFLHYNLEYLV